jgi:hypothetical protein
MADDVEFDKFIRDFTMAQQSHDDKVLRQFHQTFHAVLRERGGSLDAMSGQSHPWAAYHRARRLALEQQTKRSNAARLLGCICACNGAQIQEYEATEMFDVLDMVSDIRLRDLQILARCNKLQHDRPDRTLAEIIDENQFSFETAADAVEFFSHLGLIEEVDVNQTLANLPEQFITEFGRRFIEYAICPAKTSA